jgi:cyclohexyl-isocyanide hydratase
LESVAPLCAAGHPRFARDRHRLTGAGISAGLDEALKLIELLQNTSAAENVRAQKQYCPCLPVASSIFPPPQHCLLPPRPTARRAASPSN